MSSGDQSAASSNLSSAVNAAKDFEREHYDTNGRGEAQPLAASDFQDAAAKAGDAVKDTAAQVKNAVTGGAQEKQPGAAADIAAPAPSSSAPSASDPSPASSQPASADRDTADELSLSTQLQNKTAETLDSLQRAVEPTAGDKSADPEVNEFRSLVGEVFANMKESIQSGTAVAPQAKESASPDAEPATSAAQQNAKPTKANSPAESHSGFLAQVKAAGAKAMEVVMPEVQAGERTPGEAPVGEGKSKGLLEDLGTTAERAVEETLHHHHEHKRPLPAGSSARSAGQKWDDAKAEAKEGGRDLDQAARDAASAAGQQGRRTAGTAEAKAEDFLQRSGNAAIGVAQEGVDLTGRARDRVAGDWERTKEGAHNQLDESAAHKHEPSLEEKKEEGLFGRISNAVKSVMPGHGDAAGDKAYDTADRASDKAGRAADRASDKAGRAADRASDKAYEAKEETKGYLDKADREAGRLVDETRDEANRIGGKISDTAEGAKRTVEDKLHAAEDYLTADMAPASAGEAAVQHGEIPSNTADVAGKVPTTNPQRY